MPARCRWKRTHTCNQQAAGSYQLLVSQILSHPRGILDGEHAQIFKQVSEMRKSRKQEGTRVQLHLPTYAKLYTAHQYWRKFWVKPAWGMLLLKGTIHRAWSSVERQVLRTPQRRKCRCRHPCLRCPVIIPFGPCHILQLDYGVVNPIAINYHLGDDFQSQPHLWIIFGHALWHRVIGLHHIDIHYQVASGNWDTNHWRCWLGSGAGQLARLRCGDWDQHPIHWEYPLVMSNIAIENGPL